LVTKNSVWSRLIACISELDCLCSLSLVSTSCASGPMCRPTFLTSQQAGNRNILNLKQMRHPCVSETISNFIPNDTQLGQDKPSGDGTELLLLVTGPNMGGKSTILRQTCLAVLMAQLGCYVTAESCEMTPVDRIFTRIGASDRIIEGKSTFYVEMEETKNILSHATEKSLVIMDELGRGTSTFDGVSIAFSVLDYMCDQILCRTLFTTHYHMLLKEFRTKQNLSMYHMAAHIDEQENVTFLYKFARGECPKSYGVNVARLAGLL